jgi:hypothetical protein
MEKKFNISVFIISGAFILAMIVTPLVFSARIAATFYDDYWVYLMGLVINFVTGIFSATLLVVLLDVLSYRKSVKRLLLEFFEKANGIQKNACAAFDASTIHHLSAQIKSFQEWHEKTVIHLNQKKNTNITQIMRKMDLIFKKIDEIKNITNEIQNHEKAFVETKDNMLYLIHHAFVLAENKNPQKSDADYREHLTDCASIKNNLQDLYSAVKQKAEELLERIAEFYAYVKDRRVM